jgi:Fe2+ or Zn2+ uptake regulation protein
VAALLGESARHDWSLEQITAELGARGAKVDFSSVYRAVQGLVDDGLLRRLELGASGSRFEAAGEHHEHIQCERCGAIATVPGCTVSESVPEVEQVTGYQITGHEVLFRGVCPACADRRAGQSR